MRNALVNKELSIFDLEADAWPGFSSYIFLELEMVSEFYFTILCSFISSVRGTHCILIFITCSVYLNNDIKEKMDGKHDHNNTSNHAVSSVLSTFFILFKTFNNTLKQQMTEYGWFPP